MSAIKFGTQIESLQADSIDLAKLAVPDFTLAREMLHEAEDLVVSDTDPLKAAVFSGRNANDLGVIDVREGLYLRSHANATNEEALAHVTAGIDEITFSYISLVSILFNNELELSERHWTAGVHGHVAGTMNAWFRATQTAQLLAGDIGPKKKADRAAVDAQWMLGRGKPDEPGAYVHGKQGDNGYWSTQTSFLGLRGERINGGSVHFAKAVKWCAVRGIPELGRRLVTDSANRKQATLTAGRLSLESITRKGAIAAALDYRRF